MKIIKTLLDKFVEHAVKFKEAFFEVPTNWILPEGYLDFNEPVLEPWL